MHYYYNRAAELEEFRRNNMLVVQLHTGTPTNLRSNTMAASNGQPPFTTEAPALRDAVTLSDEEKAKYQAWMEDKVVRAVRDAGHCAEALPILDQIFGAPLDKVGVYDTRGSYYGSGYGSKRAGHLYLAYLDSDGVDCWGNVWRDANGFDRTGFNDAGYDKDGFNKDGFNAAGWNREGFDKNGLSKDDPSRFKFDRHGYDPEGYNAQGYNRDGWNREGKSMRGRTREGAQFAFDVNGFDVDGWNSDGYNRTDGYSAAAARKYSGR